MGYCRMDNIRGDQEVRSIVLPLLRFNAVKAVHLSMLPPASIRMVLRGCCRSECTPSRLARIRQLKLDGRDSEKTNDGRLVRVLLYPVIMRGPRDAPDESPRGNRNRAVRIEVGAAVHPPRAGKNEREAIRRVGMRGAHVAWAPLHQHEIGSGPVQAST